MTTELSITEDLQEWGIEGSIRDICIDAFSAFAKTDFNFSDSKYFNVFSDFIVNDVRIDEMKKLESILLSKFNIKKDELAEVYKGLNVSLNIYATYRVMPFIYGDIVKALDKLDKIARAATRLRKLLPEGDDALIGLLDIAVITEKGLSGGGEVKDYFKNLDITLLDLIKTKKILSQTQVGKLFGFGSAKRKGNMSLKLWMHTLYNIWTVHLGRSVDYDGPNGVNGRTRFIDFCYETLVEFDPTVQHHSIENLYRSDPSCSFGS